MRLSIITVSRDERKVAGLRDSVHACFAGGPTLTELIAVDGSTHDLFTGYNAGAKEAEGDAFLFTHDDVRLLGNTTTFQEPLRLLEKPLTGVIGVAGAVSLPKEGCWWTQDQKSLRGCVHHPSDGPFKMHANVWPFQAGLFGRVLICDGVFLMISRASLERLGGFSEGSYQGFHFYDIDLCLKAHSVGLRNYVAPIPVFHGSPGVPNENWEENRQKLIARWSGTLPAAIEG